MIKTDLDLVALVQNLIVHTNIISHYGKSRTLTTRDDLSPISDPLL